MKIYLLQQNYNADYETYDSVVVCAHDEEDAKNIHPDGREFVENEPYYLRCWAITKEQIKCYEIGTANPDQERGVILASYNAG
jgi:hypothetical protein